MTMTESAVVASFKMIVRSLLVFGAYVVLADSFAIYAVASHSDMAVNMIARQLVNAIIPIGILYGLTLTTITIVCVELRRKRQ